jgi:4-hydroxy-L-threonine phosphate dehydrogenase PdxA
MNQNRINLAVLLGDPSGIGPELISKLLTEKITEKANIVIIGEKNILESGNKISGNFFVNLMLSIIFGLQELHLIFQLKKFQRTCQKRKNYQTN